MKVELRLFRTNVTCHYCKEFVPAGRPVVYGIRRAVQLEQKLYWHPDCWIKEATDELLGHPEAMLASLTAEDRVERVRMLRKGARLRQIIRELAPDFPNTVVRMGKVWERMEATRDKLAKLGGVPEGWDVSLAEMIAEELGVELDERSKCR